MILTTLEKKNQEKQFCLFETIFLFVNFSMNIVLAMLFPTISNIKKNFLRPKICQRTYAFTETILTIKQIKQGEKREVAVTAFNKKYKICIMNMFTLINFNSHFLYF